MGEIHPSAPGGPSETSWTSLPPPLARTPCPTGWNPTAGPSRIQPPSEASSAGGLSATLHFLAHLLVPRFWKFCFSCLTFPNGHLLLEARAPTLIHLCGTNTYWADPSEERGEHLKQLPGAPSLTSCLMISLISCLIVEGHSG